MSSNASRVPHLARAIAERKTQLYNHANVNPHRLARTGSSLVHSSRLRCFSTTRNVRREKHSPPSNPPTRPPISLSSSRYRTVPNPPPSVRSTNAKNNPNTHTQTEDGPLKSQPEPSDAYLRRKRTFYTIFGLFSVIIGAYTTYYYRSYQLAVTRYNALPESQKLTQNEDVSDRWRDPNRLYDREVEDSERIMFMRRLRKKLVKEARGDVLEVSVGTGRNMDLYDTRPMTVDEDEPAERGKKGTRTKGMEGGPVSSFTFVDQSEVMVESARKKWADKQNEKKWKDRFRGDVRFITGDAGVEGVVERPKGGYDTVVQSMGLCSIKDAVAFLRRMGGLIRQPGEQKGDKKDDDGGRIFLLEHGRGRFTWMNSFLDNSAPMHADRYGCWYNKDIGEIVDESGLVVEGIKRYYFGTVWLVTLRPKRSSDG